jgi:hypothetical protein
MATAAFWIALAAVLIAGFWRKKSTEQMKHETVRLLIQKDGTVDPDMVKELLNPTPPEWRPETRILLGVKRWEPGESRRHMRIWGLILMVAGPGVGVLLAAIGLTRPLGFNNEITAGDSSTLIAVGIGMTIAVVLLGVALYCASQFLPKGPKGEGEGRIT